MPSYSLPAIDSNGETTNHPSNTAPTLGAVGTNWAAGPTNTGHDLDGTVTVTSSATPPVAGTVVPVTFAVPYAKPPTVVLSGGLSAWASAVTAAGFTITSLATAAASTAYTFTYNVVA